MVPSTHIGRRKIARSSHPEYQKLIDGDSIYTCSKFTAERDSRMGESILRSSKRFKRLLLVDSGPWFLELGPVLERRDEDRHRLWKRQKNKRLKRRASLAQSEDPQQAGDEEPTTGRRRSGRHSLAQSKDPQQAEEEEPTAGRRRSGRHSLAQSKDPQQAEEEEPTTGRRRSGRHSLAQSENPQQAEKEEPTTGRRRSGRHSLAQSKDAQQAEEEESTTGRGRRGRQSLAQSEDPQQAEEEEGDMTIASAVVMPSGPSTIPTNNTLEAPSRALTPDLPSSDLLRSIHHESISFYGSHNVISIPTASRGPRPKKWEEPVAMTRALDGSALMAIGVLLEEITKDLIENGLSSANPRINAE
ncbi:hypothetical protein Pst134EA_003070 [Puccinia striiformis f. sp. tritici]|uniref:hypothetical protein n=1 Tax=Puccinia striiformis f. sp. tritici TaxID=168172 RepID=UPI0020081010|nr:hypothetical protein Pst134EA_003070 [Puccinia striiformis f. sp. tritici]KAH9472456.1 hypothetical protein Pst134EA_003070 [Puccinia striiformis f. sp. tritici]